MSFISSKVLFVNDEIVVGVEFPKAAVQDVEMFVREIISHAVDVLFLI